jgi:hypothetical protein
LRWFVAWLRFVAWASATLLNAIEGVERSAACLAADPVAMWDIA